MEIVRQRRKRLLAWILTLVLCVGMWQGNVQATEGDVPAGSTQMDEGNGEQEIVNTEESPETANSYNVKIYINGFENVDDGPITTSLNEWDVTNSGGWYASKDNYQGSSLNNVSFTHGEYRHNVRKWYVFENNEKKEIKEGATLDDLGSQSVKGYVEVYAEVGKSVVINWIAENSSDSLAAAVSVAEGDSDTTVKLPVAGNKNGFIKQWTIDEETIDKSEQPYQVNFEAITEFEKNIQAMATLSKQIENEGGTYYLSQDVDYILSKGSWKVNGGTDGYTYGNSDGNIKFYVPREGEYSFGK